MPNRALLPQVSQLVGLIELEPLAPAAEQTAGDDTTLGALFERLAREPDRSTAAPSRRLQVGDRSKGQGSELVTADFPRLKRELERAVHRWHGQRRR